MPSDNMKELGDLLFDSANSFMEFGSLLFYYERLKQFLNATELERIKARLLGRKEAESVFSNYFRHPLEINEKDDQKISRPFFAKASQDLPDMLEKFPFVFFRSFVTAYQFATHKASYKMQTYITELFADALQNGPDKLRSCFNATKWPKQGKSFKEELYEIVKRGEEHKLKELTDLLTKPWEEIVLHRWRTKCNTFDANSVEKVECIGFGAYGEAWIVEVEKTASQLVAKYFNAWNYQLISGEIESLLKNQFNAHVVQLYGCIVGEGRFKGILMEFCEGGSLHDVISNSEKQYKQKDIVRWTCHAASGLLYLHENGIVHKDVKPHNMFLDAAHKNLKIGDLGISKVTARQKQESSDSQRKPNAFSTSSFFGTSGYNAREIQEQSEKYSAAIDVFSLGRSIWQMVFRVVPTDTLVANSDVRPICPELLVLKVFVETDLWNFAKTMMTDAEEERPTMLKIYEFFKPRMGKPVRRDHKERKTTRRFSL